MDKISVIIPVYNAAPYLKRCLDSVIGQTYNNLEILLIDDGSSDNSVEICEEYASKDNRIRVFYKETKGGSGSPCRSANIGLKNFTGQYVGYVEPDDWIEPDMYEVLYNTVKDNGVTIGIANYFNDDSPCSNRTPFPEGAFNAKDLIDYTFDDKNRNGFILTVQWNKLYSAEIFINNKDLLFDTDLILGFDLLFSVSAYLTEGCTGAYNDKPLYHYCIYNSSISHSAENSLKKAYDSVKALKTIDGLLSKTNYDVCSNFAVNSFRKKHYDNRLLSLALECAKCNDEKLYTQTLSDLRHFGGESYIEWIEIFQKKYLTKERYAELKVKGNSNILLFGSGAHGENKKETLEANGIKAKYFVDNDNSKHGKTICGLKVISFEESLEIPDKTYILTVHYIHAKDVYEQLISNNIPAQNVFIV